MAKASVDVPNIGTVFITKKRGQRSMRLRVDAKGQIQVSIPWFTPRAQAVAFAKSKHDWIIEQQAETHFKPYNGMLFGKTLQLVIRENSEAVRSKQDGKNVIVHFESRYDPDDSEHIKKIEKAIMKALRTEAEVVLLPRLREFADEYGFTYKSSSIKHVVGRWGSCDSQKHIVLSIFLTQLPIEMIDYVLIHELTHTVHMNHSPAFWQDVAKFCPDYKELRRNMRGLRPKIYDAKTFMA